MSHLGRFIIVQRAICSNIWTGVLKNQKTFMGTSVNHEENQTMATIMKKLINILKAEPTFIKQSHQPREELLKYLPKSQDELPVRKMKDSFDTAIIPLSNDWGLRDRYTTSFGGVRVGRLMEDLDLMAVWCCVKHISGGNPSDTKPFPYTIVTIRIDGIEIMGKSQVDADIRLSGHVSWVGRSSFEVFVRMDQFVDGKWKRILRALVLMAARNATNSGSGIVNPIEAETPAEITLLSGGEARRQKRIQVMKDSLLTNIPSEEDFHLIHELFIKTVDPNNLFVQKRILPPDSKWMKDSTLSNLVFCHPENRNLHNKIFGGFLIRQALELSWCMAVTYGLRVPRLVRISDISFHKPVDVGSLLKLYASVTYTEKEFVQVFVHADALSLSDPKAKSTTSFNFTYNLTSPVRKLYPSTYLEAMMYIDGRRRFLRMKDNRLLDFE